MLGTSDGRAKNLPAKPFDEVAFAKAVPRLAAQRCKELKARGHVKLAAYQEDVRAYRGRLAAIRRACGWPDPPRLVWRDLVPVAPPRARCAIVETAPNRPRYGLGPDSLGLLVRWAMRRDLDDVCVVLRQPGIDAHRVSLGTPVADRGIVRGRHSVWRVGNDADLVLAHGRGARDENVPRLRADQRFRTLRF